MPVISKNNLLYPNTFLRGGGMEGETGRKEEDKEDKEEKEEKGSEGSAHALFFATRSVSGFCITVSLSSQKGNR